MEAHYYLSKDPDANPHRNHEVHASTCSKLPNERIDLGSHDNCQEAVSHARVYFFHNSDGCAQCIPECHKH